MPFLGCCSWFQGYLYAGVRAVCRKAWLVVANCYNRVARVLRVVAMMFAMWNL